MFDKRVIERAYHHLEYVQQIPGTLGADLPNAGAYRAGKAHQNSLPEGLISIDRDHGELAEDAPQLTTLREAG
jgi:hypothetical protein